MTRELYRSDEPRAGLVRLEGEVMLREASGEIMREVDVRLATWGEVAQTQDGYRETLEPGAFGEVDPSLVVLESSRHDGAIVGVATRILQRAGDAIATFRVAATQAGDELLALVRPGPHGEPPVLRGASVVMAPLPGGHRIRPDGVVSRSAVELRRVAILPRGAYPSAGVLALRHHASEDDPVDPCKTCGKLGCSEHSAQPAPSPAPAAPEPAAEPKPDAKPEPVLSRSGDAPAAPDAGRVARLEQRLAALESAPAIVRGGNPLERFGSFGEVCRAAMTDGELARTLSTQLTTNNAGVLGGGPGWLSDVKGIVAQARPAVSAFVPRGLDSSGMTVDWPVFAGDLSTLIGTQSTQLDEVTSVQVDIGTDNANVLTFAGGSRLAKQTIERSSPSYRDAYERIMLAAYSMVTDRAFAANLESNATGAQALHGILGPELSGTAEADDEGVDITGHGLEAGDRVIITAKTTAGTDVFTTNRPYYVLAVDANSFQLALTAGGSAIAFATDYSAITVRQILGDDGTELFAALFAASMDVEDATGAPATVALAGSRLFAEIARMSRVVPVGPSNAVGMASAADLSVSVGNLTIKREAGLSAWGMLAGNSIAAGFHEDGPRPISADVVGNLGTDVAFYGYGAHGLYVPAGVVVLTP